MSVHVLLILLNKLGKRDKMRGLWSILSLFRNELNKFNNTGAGMLDSIYHMTLKILTNRIFGVKTSIFSLILRNIIMGIITFPESGLSILLHDIMSLPDATSYDKLEFSKLV